MLARGASAETPEHPNEVHRARLLRFVQPESTTPLDRPPALASKVKRATGFVGEAGILPCAVLDADIPPLRRARVLDIGRALGQAAWRLARDRTFASYGRRVVFGYSRLGHCPVCSRYVVFVARTDWLRDSYQCLRCGSIPRQRAFMRVLEQVAPHWRDLRIHESSPDGASSRRIARDCAAYDASQYWRDARSGSMRNGVRCEDLTRLTFADESLDLFITQDVFEHVLDAERGFAEIARVLRPGGLHVFTVPWYWWKPTLVRARTSPDGLEHLEPPDYHANPVDPAGSLVITEWGWDLPDVILRHSSMTTTAHAIRDPRRGIVGAFREVMVSRKPTS